MGHVFNSSKISKRLDSGNVHEGRIVIKNAIYHATPTKDSQVPHTNIDLKCWNRIEMIM